MESWLQAKLDQITQEFQRGEGNAMVYQASFLSYLDALVVLKHGQEASYKLWAMMRQLQRDGQSPAEYAPDSKMLVKILRKLQRSFEGPVKRPLVSTPPQSAHIKAREGSSGQQVGMSGLQGIDILLLGIDEDWHP